MIKSIKIKNFQSHKNTLLKLTPGVNIIIGNTDSGKSSIIRALKWAITNRPGGDTFRSNWGGDTSVILKTKENNIIERRKDGENIYKLNNTVFTAFKTDIPQEIKQVLNLDITNTQFQLDSPFLLSKTAGEVAQYFNKIAHIDMIDKGQKNIKKDITRYTNQIETLQDNITKNKEKLEQYEYLKLLQQKIDKADKLQKTITGLYSKKQQVIKLLNKIDDLQDQIKEQKQAISIEVLVDKTIELCQTLDELKTKKEAIRNTVLKVLRLDQQITQLKIATKVLPTINQVLEKINLQKIKKQTRTKISNLIFNVDQTTQNIIKQQNQLDKLEKEFHDKFPDVCPLCGK